MNTTNQIFSWKRYTATLRKEWVENRTMLLLFIAATFLFYLTVFSSNTSVVVDLNGHESYNYMGNFWPIVDGFSILSFIVPSLAFRHLTRKTGRVELFSLPASTTEKFAVGVTIYVIGFVVAFAACVQLADLLRYALFNHAGAPDNLMQTIKVAATSRFTQSSGANPSMVHSFTGWTDYAYIIPFFFLGSVVWPRWSALKTFGVVCMFMFIEMLIFFFQTGHVSWISMAFHHQYQVVNDAINITLMLGSLVLAWYLFKRKDIISLKWWK